MAEMQITNKLLREAIADAEAVRQTAIENAKLSLEETFTPQIKSMLERKLRTEAESMEGEEVEEAKEMDAHEAEAEGSSEMPADSSDIGAGDNKEPSDDAFDSAEDDMSGEGHHDGADDEWYEDWAESDFDLQEVIKELEEDILAMEGEKKEEGEEEGEGEEEEGEEEGEEEEGEEEGEEEAEDEGYPESEPAGDEKSSKEIPAKSDMIGLPGAATFTLEEFLSALEEAGYSLEETHPAANYVDMPSVPPVEESELNLEEILATMEAEDATIKEEEASEKMASEVKALQEELAEYRTVVNVLRGKLNEVNLLNAKLLYTNKIFRKEGLTNEQKVTIVENFDRATTVREVKMVYAVLAESLVPQKVGKVTKTAKKVVAEGLASKPTPSTAPKTPATEVLAENSVAKRLQQLAGII